MDIFGHPLHVVELCGGRREQGTVLKGLTR
jgi:hypothetical protein